MSKGHERIASILCRRDGCTREEAMEQIQETLQQMEEVNYSPCDCEDIMQAELGLEMDYIFDLLL